MTSKKNDSIKGDNLMKRVFDQTISEHDISDPKIFTTPAIEEIIRNQHNISENILKAYRKLVPEPESDKDLIVQIADGSYKYYEPFAISVYGTYPLMTHWKELLQIVELSYNKREHYKYTNNKMSYKDIDFKQYEKSKVLERLKEFAKGFKYGFETFMGKYIDSTSLISNSNENKIQRLWDFLNSIAIHTVSFQLIRKSDTVESGSIKWYDDGINAGNLYRAWHFVFVNHQLIEPYFSRKGFNKNKVKGKIDFATQINSNGHENKDNDTEGFKLLHKIGTNSCYDILKDNKFINNKTTKNEFKNIFLGTSILNKIDWIGTLPELSRFVFLLHKGEDLEKIPIVCVENKNYINVASRCFTHNGKEIVYKQLKNNNRCLKNEKRYRLLKKAIIQLDAPKLLHTK